MRDTLLYIADKVLDFLTLGMVVVVTLVVPQLLT
jgi:hypothetical protein